MNAHAARQKSTTQPMRLMLSRRDFTKKSAVLTFGFATAPLASCVRAASSPGNKLVVGVLGMGRGSAHIQALQQIENVEIAYIADVDDNRLAAGAKHFAKAERQPKAVKDFRR